jgi:hypothetical protein
MNVQNRLRESCSPCEAHDESIPKKVKSRRVKLLVVDLDTISTNSLNLPCLLPVRIMRWLSCDLKYRHSELSCTGSFNLPNYQSIDLSISLPRTYNSWNLDTAKLLRAFSRFAVQDVAKMTENLPTHPMAGSGPIKYWCIQG